MRRQYNDRQNESGNVLFLILIAVALFAALSYAVTQSTRSGGGGTDGETSLVNSAQLTQYPAGVRTSLVRMVINGIDVSELEFNPPSDFSDCTGAPSSHEQCVFHPDGGGATYVKSPPDLMADGSTGQWYFNGHFEILNIGTSSAGNASGNDIIAFLPGIASTLCNRINEELGIGSAVINNGGDWSTEYTEYMDDTYTIPSSETVIGDGSTPDLSGQPFGCFQNNADSEYVYYHVLIER